MTLALDAGDWWTSYLGHFTAGKGPHYLLNRRPDGSQSQSWRCVKRCLRPAGIWIPDHQSCSLVTVVAMVSTLLQNITQNHKSNTKCWIFSYFSEGKYCYRWWIWMDWNWYKDIPKLFPHVPLLVLKPAYGHDSWLIPTAANSHNISPLFHPLVPPSGSRSS